MGKQEERNIHGFVSRHKVFPMNHVHIACPVPKNSLLSHLMRVEIEKSLNILIGGVLVGNSERHGCHD